MALRRTHCKTGYMRVTACDCCGWAQFPLAPAPIGCCPKCGAERNLTKKVGYFEYVEERDFFSPTRRVECQFIEKSS